MKKVNFIVCFLAALLLLTVSACKKELPQLEIPEDTSSYTIAPGEILTISFTVSNVSGATIVPTVTSTDPLYNAVVNLNADGKSGEIVVTAPQYVFKESLFDVNLNIDDANNANRKVEKTYNITGTLAANFQSFDSPANSYIVSPGAFAKIAGVKGNTTTSLGVDSVKLLWQDADGLVEAVMVNEGDVYVELGEGVSGNAVIAGLAGENVVWSWHVWVTDYDPSANVMSWADANGVTYSFMDRNLGALTAEAGTDAVHGNFYQWGRKDAFPGSTYEGKRKLAYDIEGNVVEELVEPVAEVDNVPTAIANPFTHYSGVSGGNWGWITTSFAEADVDAICEYWGAVTGNKSEYDPCPAGWKIPSYEAFGFLSDANTVKTKTYLEGAAAENKNVIGWTHTVGEKDWFFPNQGEVQHSGAFASGIGTNWPCGKMWSATKDPNGTTQSYFKAMGTSVSPTTAAQKGSYTFGYTLAVRCIKE